MCQKPEKRGSLPLGSGPPISGPELGTVLFVIESFRLGEIGLRVFHELGPSLLVAEAIGLPLVDRIDGAIRRDVLMRCKAHRAHIAKLTLRSRNCRRGEPKDKGAGDRRRNV
jgi:hypothetical protein